MVKIINITGDNGAYFSIDLTDKLSDKKEIRFGSKWCRGKFYSFIDQDDIEKFPDIPRKMNRKVEWINEFGNISLLFEVNSLGVCFVMCHLIPDMSSDYSSIKFVIEGAAQESSI